jgi:uncharacterized protein with von Willebrand factor type A (vWA) domain
MTLSHPGLTALALSEKVDLTNLSAGEFVVFINTALTKVKVFAVKNTFAYYASSRKIDLRALQNIPGCFGGGTMNFNNAIEKMLRKHLEEGDL